VGRAGPHGHLVDIPLLGVWIKMDQLLAADQVILVLPIFIPEAHALPQRKGRTKWNSGRCCAASSPPASLTRVQLEQRPRGTGWPSNGHAWGTSGRGMESTWDVVGVGGRVREWAALVSVAP
jgi:hypothetical protein